MAVINDPTTASQIARVGMASGMVWVPSHVVAGPMQVGAGGAYALSQTSGSMSVSLGANSEIFQFRFVTAASRVCLVNGISISAGASVAATGAANLGFRATVARSWSVVGSGGTRAVLTGNNQKLRVGHATSEVNDAGIASTGALTAGTKTLDSQDIGAVQFGVGTGAITTALPLTICPKSILFGSLSQPMAWPLVLANQEGFVVRTAAAFPAGMAWQFEVSVFWLEVDGF